MIAIRSVMGRASHIVAGGDTTTIVAMPMVCTRLSYRTYLLSYVLERCNGRREIKSHLGSRMRSSEIMLDGNGGTIYPDRG